MPAAKSDEIRTDFQSIILNLQRYWARHGAVILQPYDMEVGAGTFHPATTLRSLGPDDVWRAAYVQSSRRPSDGRYGENPNRLQHYYQFQVILKPSPDETQALAQEKNYCQVQFREFHGLSSQGGCLPCNYDIDRCLQVEYLVGHNFAHARKMKS